MRRVTVSLIGQVGNYTFDDKPYVDKDNVALWHEIHVDGRTVSVIKHHSPEATRIIFATNAECIVRES